MGGGGQSRQEIEKVGFTSSGAIIGVVDDKIVEHLRNEGTARIRDLAVGGQHPALNGPGTFSDDTKLFFW